MNRLELMKKAAREAGEFMLGAQSQTAGSTKANANDFVTVADIKSQDILRKSLAADFPGVVILSEEDSDKEREKLQASGFTGFVLDPIDGTYNFKRGMQESAISVGYIENGQSVAGVIFDAYKDELYEAEQGSGARLNGSPIHVSVQTELAGSSVATSNGYDYAAAVRNLQRQVAIYDATGVMPWISCPGSAVLVMAWTACARVDAMHHTGFKPWDNAAAMTIVREAGGKVLTLKGEQAKFTDAKLLLGTPAIVDQLLEIFAKLPAELLE
ncbi:MAG TPA: inositol monophosphatase family protein [Candidatus Saccharimonadales bacterium]|nr:inositol monophosphatase family protein [Candidatus Saccharimonadales bacterium]